MIPKLEDCRPGLEPMGYTVLVAINVLEEKTAGGIILPGKHLDRENGASEKGLIVAVSPMAFQGGDWQDGMAPAPGATVLFQRYAGTEFEGADGRKYRIVQDAELKGVFDGN
jgi:co-chaperonin GroES (HSP10)